MELERNTRSKKPEVQVIFTDASEAGLFGSVRFHPLNFVSALNWDSAVARLSNGGEQVTCAFKPAKLEKLASALLNITPDNAPAFYAGEHLPTKAAQENGYRVAQRLGGQIIGFLHPRVEDYIDR